MAVVGRHLICSFRNQKIENMPIGPELIGRLLDRHAPALALYARQLCDDPDDVVQRAFIKLAEQHTAPQSPVAWLFKVVRHEALMESRSVRRRKRRETQAAQLKTNCFRSSADDAIDAGIVADALVLLADQQREIVTSHIWGGLTFREIGELLGISDSTAHRRYQEALESLRKQMGASCQNN